MNLVLFCLADWAGRAVMKMSAILLKHPTFKSVLSQFHGPNKYIRASVHCSVHTKKFN